MIFEFDKMIFLIDNLTYMLVNLRKFKATYALTFVLSLYLLLFSSFALFHAYAQDEISDPQGCQIGLWVQHGEQLSQFSSPPPVGLVFLFNLSPINPLVLSSFEKGPLSNRGPPSLTLL
ncbi:MAG TPA: hypothetical protein VGB26_15025 [Nitrospiria bacterium]